MYSFSRCSVELRDTNTNCVIGSLAICYGIRLWLVWAVVYVVTFALAYTKYTRRQPFKRGVHLHPPYPPLDPPLGTTPGPFFTFADGLETVLSRPFGQPCEGREWTTQGTPAIASV